MIQTWSKRSCPFDYISLHEEIKFCGVLFLLFWNMCIYFYGIRLWDQQCISENHCEFLVQNPGHQPASVLSFTLPQLIEKLRDGSLSPESVLYTYLDKVRTGFLVSKSELKW